MSVPAEREQEHKERVRAAKQFEKAVEKGIEEVALNQARFQVQVSDKVESAGQKGIDHTEFYFSANVGEEVKPLARVASGGEASRLMLVLKTVANGSQFPRTIVFEVIGVSTLVLLSGTEILSIARASVGSVLTSPGLESHLNSSTPLSA